MFLSILFGSESYDDGPVCRVASWLVVLRFLGFSAIL